MSQERIDVNTRKEWVEKYLLCVDDYLRETGSIPAPLYAVRGAIFDEVIMTVHLFATIRTTYPHLLEYFKDLPGDDLDDTDDEEQNNNGPLGIDEAPAPGEIRVPVRSEHYAMQGYHQ